MAKRVRVSLANKCQLLFGAAVVLILTAALAVVWFRLQKLVSEGQEEKARQLANAWLDDRIQLGGALTPFDNVLPEQLGDQGLSLTLLEPEEFEFVSQRDPFLAGAIERFQSRDDAIDRFTEAHDDNKRRYFRYARAIRKSDLLRIGGGAAGGFSPALDLTALADPLEMVLLIEFRSASVEQQLTLNRMTIVAAGLLAGLLAIGAFWFITTRIILSPVRVLRDTAEKVSDGDLNIRAEIATGDEFEQLSEMFNQMLVNLKEKQDQMRGANKSLDLKLGELAESNLALYEANKMKGEFLANVSHELRTPLNSIIGFAELLDELKPEPADGKQAEKHHRYIGNIISSSRRLLDLINDLLDLAKIEAGRMELRIAPMSVADTSEGLVNLVKPLAKKGDVTLLQKIASNLPMVHTDASKLQQILFNFLSNAIKFTPAEGTVTLAAELVPPDDTHIHPRVRMSVSDTGPGIPMEQQERIFQKFVQLDAGIDREHAGTGLGLTISQELASLLQAEITVDSDVGRGATFALIIPLLVESRGTPLMPEATFRIGDAP